MKTKQEKVQLETNERSIGYRKILLWHLDRMSKCTGLVVHETMQVQIDTDKVFADQVRYLHRLLFPIWDDDYTKAVDELTTDKDDTRYLYEAFFGHQIMLMHRNAMLLKDADLEESD